MSILSALPIEIWLDIIDSLKPYYTDAPITGVNAGWTKLTSVCYVPPNYPADQSMSEPWITANKERSNKLRTRSPLWEVRQVCKALNDLCCPVLFQELNFLKQDPDVSLESPVNCGHLVQSIRILIDPFTVLDPESDPELRYQEDISRLLRACPNLTSIALYYCTAGSSMGPIGEEVYRHMNAGKIQALGIYSILVLHTDVGQWQWNHIHPTASNELLERCYLEPELTRSLQRLDIVVETLSQEAYDVIRMNFPALESLTIRRGIRSNFGRIWDTRQRDKWGRKPNLTHFHIIDCLAGYAPHVPELVRHFGSLKHLTISTCGDEDDVIPSSRNHGWSSHPDALCHKKSILDSIHIEHMEGWEIRALGVIPTRKITLSNILHGHFIRVLEDDPEIFPSLQDISVLPLYGSDNMEEADKKLKEVLDSLCKRRKIRVTADGYHIKTSLGSYGFA